MRIVKRFLFSCLLICALSIPASTFATSGSTYSNQNFFQTVFDFIFSEDNGAEYWGNKSSNGNDWFDYEWVKSYGQNQWDDWKEDRDDQDLGNWDGCLKHENRCIESIDIWRDWYCGKEDKDHKHDYAWLIIKVIAGINGIGGNTLNM
ncbi:hypothetical protein [Metabacillus sp. FJAT-53654]|uniref:Uncharacterized protein n=1 Tax=Metabacillus rhizosphaerae TaxID=3117747 RepID=A0ABZ2MXY3_9BACI